MFETRFVDGHDAVEQAFDLFLVDIDAGNVDTKLREAGSSDESYITSTDNSNMHEMEGLYKILRVTRISRVTRKVNSGDRSAGSQCHSVFLTQPNETTWSG